MADSGGGMHAANLRTGAVGLTIHTAIGHAVVDALKVKLASVMSLSTLNSMVWGDFG